MILSINYQIYLFLVSVLCGFISAIIYDLLRVIRMIIPHFRLLIHIEDLIYWILISVFIFGYLFFENYAQVRFYFIAGTFIGMIIYFNTISIFLINFFQKNINFIKKVLKKCLKYVTIKLTKIKTSVGGIIEQNRKKKKKQS